MNPANGTLVRVGVAVSVGTSVWVAVRVGAGVSVGGNTVGVFAMVGEAVGCGAEPAQATNSALISVNNASLFSVFFIGSSSSGKSRVSACNQTWTGQSLLYS